MERFQNTLETDIREQLPTLSAEHTQQLLYRLLEVAEHTADLPHVDPADLQPLLRKASAKRFVSFFQHKYGRSSRPTSQSLEIQEDEGWSNEGSKLKGQDGDSSTENINRQRNSGSFPKRRQALKKRSFERAISLPPPSTQDQQGDSPSGEQTFSDLIRSGNIEPTPTVTSRLNGTETMAAGLKDKNLDLAKSEFVANKRGDDNHEASIQFERAPRLNQKHMPIQGYMSAEQKCSECDSPEADALMRDADALMRGSLQTFRMPLPSVPSDQDDVVYEGGYVNRSTPSSAEDENNSVEHEKGNGKNKRGVFDKLRKFTFGLLSSDKSTDDWQPFVDDTFCSTEEEPSKIKVVQPHGPFVSRDIEGIMVGKEPLQPHAKARNVHFAEVHDTSRYEEQHTWQRATINQRQFIRKCSSKRKTETERPTLKRVDRFWDSDDCQSIDSETSSGDDSEEEEEEEQDAAQPLDVPKAVKLKFIAMELLSTEQAYVNRLHLLDQVFQLSIEQENKTHHMFPDDVIPQMFSNISSIYQFHNNFLLPEIAQRMTDWRNTPKIGDVMSKFAPFLKLYSEYVTNLDRAIKTVNKWQQCSTKFPEILAELEKRPECERLLLQQHMMEPLQRLPRYQLLLKEYLAHLPEDAEDRLDTERALTLVAAAASHANQTLRKNEEFHRLQGLNEKLQEVVDLSDPARQLVKEGRVFKRSPTNGTLSFRYVFLFSDRLLVCTEYRLCSFTTYRVDTVLNVDTMQLVEGDNLEMNFTFYVKTRSRTVELHCSTPDEMQGWLSAIQNVLAEYRRRLMTRLPEVTTAEDDKLGHSAPTWVKDQHVSMCMVCATPFCSVRRRHHCRCCGIVVCRECSSNKASLAYQDNKPDRVCDKCYEALKLQNDELGIIGVKGSDPSVVSGMMLMSSDMKIWERRWFALHENFVLYTFKAPQDIQAMTSTSLPGYTVSEATEEDHVDKERVIKISHPNDTTLVYFFHVENSEFFTKWQIALQCAADAELPPEYATSMWNTDRPPSGNQTKRKCLMFET